MAKYVVLNRMAKTSLKSLWLKMRIHFAIAYETTNLKCERLLTNKYFLEKANNKHSKWQNK